MNVTVAQRWDGCLESLESNWVQQERTDKSLVCVKQRPGFYSASLPSEMEFEDGCQLAAEFGIFKSKNKCIH